MKTPLVLALAASLLLSGCSLLQRSSTWESVVSSRSQYSGSGGQDAKSGYLNHLHQVLASAGVEHKLVTYQFRYDNAFREEAVQTAVAILYRDEHNPGNPWWIMDEYHHVPVWLPSWELEAQIEFFVRRQAEVLSVKEFGAGGTPPPRAAKIGRATQPTSIARTPRERKFRTLFADSAAPAKVVKLRPKKAAVTFAPPTAKTASSDRAPLAGNAADPDAAALFRQSHGTQFDPGSRVDRAKMDELRRTLLNRSQRIGLRTP